MTIPYRLLLRETACAVLRASGTDAGEKVFTARSTPTSVESLPQIVLQVPIDHGESLGRSAPGLTRVACLVVVGKVSHKSEDKTQLALDRLGSQIEYALMQSPDLQRMIQQVTELDIRTQIDASSETFLGMVTVRLGLEYTEYFKVTGLPLKQIDGHLSANGNDDFADLRVTFSNK
ncbi:hypothetical protein [Asaia astilbis]|uniref:hypothetical protein n=1 Tax=Asaia astilbis TaxID=610244 RepID=UPI00046E8F97|nr:hypothetical protein [Asaia astilbis]